MSSPGRARRREARGQEPRQRGPLVVAAWPGSFGDVLRNIRRSGNCRAADPGELALQATLDLVEVLLAVRGAQRLIGPPAAAFAVRNSSFSPATRASAASAAA